ncbi:MAG: biopolymer transporter ExbD [Proteobacteria bacterium]|nr:biopolymer transporter ExbD [Pseudomonadota bacterium]
MASKLSGGDDEAIVDINITPFVDIILVVLIIFMVTATYIVQESIKVNLPEAATGEATEDSSLAITIDAQGLLYLDGEQINKADLRAKIVQEKQLAQKSGADVVCLIGADHAVSHGEVVSVIDLVKQEGIAKFALNIDPVEEDTIRQQETSSAPIRQKPQ